TNTCPFTLSNVRAQDVPTKRWESERHHRQESCASLPGPLLDRITSRCAGKPGVRDLLIQFLQVKGYSQEFSLDLINIARGSLRDRWELRRLAALMLENQILKIRGRALPELDLLLTVLGIKLEPGPNAPISKDVLAQGYSSTHLPDFAVEFRQKLSRLNRVHNRIRGFRTSRSGLEDFLEASRRDCKITGALYLFSPDVADRRILGQVNTSKGVRDINFGRPRFIEQECEHALRQMPDYEAQIVRQLISVPDIYWVSDATSSELNSLVEYPQGTVVLVVKPPGS